MQATVLAPVLATVRWRISVAKRPRAATALERGTEASAGGGICAGRSRRGGGTSRRCLIDRGGDLRVQVRPGRSTIVNWSAQPVAARERDRWHVRLCCGRNAAFKPGAHAPRCAATGLDSSTPAERSASKRRNAIIDAGSTRPLGFCPAPFALTGLHSLSKSEHR